MPGEKVTACSKNVFQNNPQLGLSHNQLGTVTVPPLLDTKRCSSDWKSGAVSHQAVKCMVSHQACQQQIHKHMAHMYEGIPWVDWVQVVYALWLSNNHWTGVSEEIA